MPSGIAVVAALLAWSASLDPRWHALLDYHRDDVAGGQAWRLVTAHVMHLSAEHALLDIAGLALVAWIFSAELGWRSQAIVCVVGMAFIDVALWTSHIDRYVGLSGVLHAWFAAGTVRWLFAERDDPAQLRKRAWGAVLAVGLGAKLILEQHQQAFWLDGTSLTVVTLAHRWGAAAGVLCGVAAAVRFRRRDGSADAAVASRAQRPRGCRVR